MSMNDNPLGNNDFSEFVLANDDPRNNLFMRNDQVQGSLPSVNNMACDTGNGYMEVSSPTCAQDGLVSPDDITPIVDFDALNRGFAEIENDTHNVPTYNMISQNVGTNLLNGDFPEGRNISMPPNTMLPNGSPVKHVPENQPMTNGRKSYNPYADYLKYSQQTDAANSDNIKIANMQGPTLTIPSYTQGDNPLYPTPQIANMPGMIPDTLHASFPGMNGTFAKKRNTKTTAYDIMTDFITRAPMFIHKQKVYIYDGMRGYYRYTSQCEVEQMIMGYYRPIIRESGSGTLIEKVYKLLLKEPKIVRNEVPLSDPTKLSFANCTVDLQTLTMDYHSPVNVVTHALNCDLARFNHQSENCPVFDKFLHDISGGDVCLELRIWQILGYCLTPDTNVKGFFLLQGVPNSGKSKFCDLLSDFFPEEKVSAFNIHSLKEQFSMGNLDSMALCVSPDLLASALDPKSASSIKQLTGNDIVSADMKHRSNTQFRFEGKLILVTNYPLVTTVPDDAFMQRAIVVPFLHAVPQEEQDGNLLNRLKAEKPAIASKALDAYFLLRNNHYRFAGNYEINSSLLYPGELLGSPEITPLVYNFLMSYFEKDPKGLVTIESAYEMFSQIISNQFTEKMFSSSFQRLAEELYGANKIRSYHGGKYKNARSSVEGIRLKQGAS